MSFYSDRGKSKTANLDGKSKYIISKNKQISLLKKGRYSLTPKALNTRSGKRAASCTFRRGSLTVEAAMVLPLFFLSLLACICLMGVYARHMETTVRLQEQAEKLGMYAHGLSDAREEMIDLTERVQFRIPFFPFLTLEFDCRSRVKPWTGRTPEEAGEGEGTKTVLVYMTENGSVYHTTSRCSHLSLSIRRVPRESLQFLRNKQGGIYRACEKCVGEGQAQAILLITDEGDCYHNSLECSGLKRAVRLVELEAVEGIPCCSRCRELEAGGGA